MTVGWWLALSACVLGVVLLVTTVVCACVVAGRADAAGPYDREKADYLDELLAADAKTRERLSPTEDWS